MVPTVVCILLLIPQSSVVGVSASAAVADAAVVRELIDQCNSTTTTTSDLLPEVSTTSKVKNAHEVLNRIPGIKHWLVAGAVRIKHYDELNGTIIFNVRIETAEPDVTLQCTDGIKNVADGVCCHHECGGCGGSACGSMRGAAANCCSSAIKRSGKVCGASPPPCMGTIKNGQGSTGYLIVQAAATAQPVVLKQTVGLFPRESGCGNWGYGQGYVGYADPRLFEWNEQVWVLLNGCSARGRRMYLHDVQRNRTVRLWWHGEETGGQQKNWTPFVWKGNLRLIFGFGVSRAQGVLEVVNPTSGEARLVQGALTYNHSAPFHGSTPLLHWKDALYVGFAHTRHAAPPNRKTPLVANVPTSHSPDKVYRAVPFVFNAVSTGLEFGVPVHFQQPVDPLAEPWVAFAGRKRPWKDVQFPYGFHVERHPTTSAGTLQFRLALEYQDRCPAWVALDSILFCRMFKGILQTAAVAAAAATVSND
jgi:hypothetical protein